MNDRVPCGNYEALITYVYDECEPAEREQIALHLAQCASCTEEIQALQDTRAHLGAWSPPSLPLGFQITRTDATQPANVLRPSVWWRRPLPAWAQAAAAVLIFAAGMSVNAFQQNGVAPVATQKAAADVRPVSSPSVSRADVARLDERLRSLENAQVERVSVQVPRTAGAGVDERELLDRVQALVDARIALAEQQQDERNYTALTRVAQQLGVIDERAQNQEEALRTMMGGSFVRASFSPAATRR